MKLTETVDKITTFLALYQHGTLVHVHFDPRTAVVPPAFRKDARVLLQYGSQLVVPIPDLEVSEEGLRATLSFDRKPFATFVPWDAVRAIGGEVGNDTIGKMWEPEPAKLPEPTPDAGGNVVPLFGKR